MQEKPIRVAAYVRVSTTEQAESGLSLEVQRARIKAFCDSQGWCDVEFFEDAGESGATLERPAMRTLLARVRSSAVDVLVVYRLDRLSRRNVDLWNLIGGELDRHKVGFKSVTEAFDTTTAQGNAFVGMLSVFAQFERDTIRDRTRDAMSAKRERGQHCGRIPFGFRIDEEGRLTRDADQQKTIARAKRLRREGKSFRSISGQLGVPLGTVYKVINTDARGRK